MNFLITNKPVDFNLLRDQQGDEVIQKKINGVYYYYQSSCEIYENDDLFLIRNGYWHYTETRHDNQAEENLTIAKTTLTTWPLSDDISGSYAAVVHDKNTNSITFCNDVIGLYPVYFKITDTTILISSSILMASLVGQAEIDQVGLTQCILGYENSLVGRRSLLKHTKRLLPGEWCQVNLLNNSTTNAFDNTLYGDVQTSKTRQKSSVFDYWKVLKNEIQSLSKHQNKINLALSGGLDSRLILGALEGHQKVKCLTYGSDDSYEVKIAKRLARIKQYEFENFSDLDLYFPSKEILTCYQKDTAAVNIMSWLEILENSHPSHRELILLGDMCEVLPGRNIKTFGGREQRVKNFLKYFVFNKAYEFTEGNKENFEAWKINKTKRYLKSISKNRLDDVNSSIDLQTLHKEIKSDLEDLYQRIEAHHLPYAELYDELFAWYTHSRIPMSKQILVCQSKFKSVCPTMSSKMMRLSSNIHPNERMNYRFKRKLFKSIDELKRIKNIPTSQAPLIPRYLPSAILFVVWGLRSKVDVYFIKRLMKRKDPSLRYRLFKGLNWVQVYQHPKLEERLNSYFKMNYLGKGLVQKIKDTVLKRKRLEKWPLSNIDVMTLAALNVELELIGKNISKSENRQN